MRARVWFNKYQGAHPIHSYKKAFGVDTNCALRDLFAICAISELQYMAGMRAEEKRILTKKVKKEECLREEHFPDSNDEFYYIEGYTGWGFAYGITWEEMNLQPYEREEE